MNSKQVLAKHFTRTEVCDPTGAQRVKLQPDQLQPQQNQVLFTKNGQGRLYWSTRAE